MLRSIWKKCGFYNILATGSSQYDALDGIDSRVVNDPATFASYSGTTSMTQLKHCYYGLGLSDV